MVGRERELALARDVVRGLGTLLIEGEPGIGKTSLWRATVQSAGCRVLTCTARPGQSPFAGLADLLAGFEGELPAPQREALDRLRRSQARALGVAVRSLLLAAAPVVVAIDDAQWLDDGTAGALAFALRRLSDAPVGVLVSGADPFACEGVTRLRLGPLEPDALRALLPRTAARARIVAAAAGNPLVALELASARPGLGPLPVTTRLRELVAERVAGREALAVAAAVAAPTVELVERAGCADALLEAEDAGLLRVEAGRVRFTRPLDGLVAYAAADRRELHRRLAGLVREPSERARQLALAADPPDERIAAWLEEAGEPEAALAFTAPAAVEAVERRALRAAELHVRTGDPRHARPLLERVSSRRALRLRAAVLAHEEGVEAALPLLEQADDAEAERELAHARGCARHAERAVVLAARGDDPALLGAALATRELVAFRAGRGVDWRAVQRAVTLDGSSLPWRPRWIAACLKLWTGQVDEAHAELPALHDERVAPLLAWLELLRGDFAAAAGHVEEAARADGAPERALALAVRAQLAAHRGDVDGARSGGASPWAEGALALAALSHGDAEAAWAAVAPLVPDPLVLGLAIEALIGLGELDRAQSLLERGVPLAVVDARCRGLLLAARGDLDAALRVLAVEGPFPFELARTRLAEGRVLLLARRKREARAVLERALGLFDEVGAPGWAERAREALARCGGPAAQRGELTPAERRVVDLAARGLANKQIARALHVTVHTVEVHLSRAYAKLGVRSRTQLAAAFSRAG